MRRYQGYGGTRFVKDDLAGDPRGRRLGQQWAGAALHHGPSAQHCNGAQAAADLFGAGAAGLQLEAFRSQLPQDAAEYVRLNVLPRPGWRSRLPDCRPAQ